MKIFTEISPFSINLWMVNFFVFPPLKQFITVRNACDYMQHVPGLSLHALHDGHGDQ